MRVEFILIALALPKNLDFGQVARINHLRLIHKTLERIKTFNPDRREKALTRLSQLFTALYGLYPKV